MVNTNHNVEFCPSLALEGLRELSLSYMGFETNLIKCPELINLELSACHLSVITIDNISQLVNLERLVLSHIHVNYSGGGVSILFASLTRLKYLSLRCFWVLKDKNLKNIGGLISLVELDLTGCNLSTDDCLKYIAKLKNLSILYVAKCTNFTAKGLATLKGVVIMK